MKKIKHDLVQVSVWVHPANLDRLMAQAKLWEVDASSVDARLWDLARDVANGDDIAARTLLESSSVTFGWRRVIDVAVSGPEGLEEVREHLERIFYGIHT